MEFVYPILIFFVVMGIVFGVLLVVISRYLPLRPMSVPSRSPRRYPAQTAVPAAMPAVQTMPMPS